MNRVFLQTRLGRQLLTAVLAQSGFVLVGVAAPDVALKRGIKVDAPAVALGGQFAVAEHALVFHTDITQK